MFEELKDYIASHTKEEILIKDFEEKKNPGYYIKDVHTYPKPNITIYSKKDNKLIKSCVFLNTTGKYNL